MARTTYEDDEFEDIKSTFKPGDISDIFESDDDDYTIDSAEDDYDDDDDEYDGDYRDFDILEETTTVNDIVNNENLEDKDDESEKENDITPEFDSTEEVIDEMSDEEKWLNSIKESKEDTSDNTDDDTFEETVVEEVESEEPVIEVEESEDKTFSEIIAENNVSEDIEEITEDTEKEEIVEESKPEEPVSSQVEVNIELNEAIINDSESTEREQEVRQFLVDRFRQMLKHYYSTYRESDLVSYINQYIDKDNNRDIFREKYIKTFTMFSSAIDFGNIDASQALWVVSAGQFADEIELQKSLGDINSEVVENAVMIDSSKVIEDENIRMTREYQRMQDEKMSKYKLDRTVFNITDSEDEENCSIFADKRTLDKDFYDSEFYSIHNEVMASDRFADMSKITSKITINEETSYIPIIDYSSGIRVICIDTNDTDQYRLNPMFISRKVPFRFQTTRRNPMKVRVLYSDDCKNRPMAVICSLKKLIGYEYIKSRYKIKLNRNYVIAYTTELRWVEMFEKGDPDSHKPESSPYYTSKPANMAIGVIVLDAKSEKDRRAIRRHQIERDVGRYEPASADNYNIEFVLSARIIRNDLKLRNPTLPKNERYVEYIITQYTEANPVIILDGLQVILACIIREHKANYSVGTPYAISLEYDRDSLISPAVIAMLDERDGLEPAYGSRPNNVDIESQFILPPSRLKLSGVFDHEKGRLDKKFFNAAGIQRRYPRELWNNYDLTTRDGRIQFVRSRGFEEFFHIKPVMFDVMPYALNMIETSDMIQDITKVSIDMLADRNSSDSENILFKQNELNYRKSVQGTPYGKFQMFLVDALNYLIDDFGKKNKQE
jgi:hypothetical protein